MSREEETVLYLALFGVKFTVLKYLKGDDGVKWIIAIVCIAGFSALVVMLAAVMAITTASSFQAD